MLMMFNLFVHSALLLCASHLIFLLAENNHFFALFIYLFPIVKIFFKRNIFEKYHANIGKIECPHFEDLVTRNIMEQSNLI